MKNRDASGFIKVAPYMLLISVAGIIATVQHNKFYMLAVLVAPMLGMIQFASSIWCWKTGKAWIAAIPSPFWVMLCISSANHGGLLWGLPQFIAIATLFFFAPLWISGKAIIFWLSNETANK